MKRLGGYFYDWPAIQCLPKVFVAMSVGVYVACTRFIIPAIFLLTLGWAFAIHFLNQIAHAAGQHDLADVIAMNLVGLLSGILAALPGAIVSTDSIRLEVKK